MDKDIIEADNYLARQNFSDQEIKNLHQGKLNYKEGNTEE
jgi:hypothetical protein